VLPLGKLNRERLFDACPIVSGGKDKQALQPALPRCLFNFNQEVKTVSE
jgi:hypothetical protein